MMRSHRVVLHVPFLVAMLAGCSVPLPEPQEPAAFVFAFAEPVLVGPGGDVETTVHVTADGTILVCSHGGFWQPSPLWVSEDGGETFRRLDPRPNPIVSGDCDLTSSSDGAWAIVYDTIASATVAVSTDRGASWSLNHASALPIAVDRPWIHWAGTEVWLTYANVMVAEPAVQMFARSTDGGRTWTEHNVIHIAEYPDRLQAIIGKMVALDGQIRIPLARGNLGTGGPVGIDHAISIDGGRTWRLEHLVQPYDMQGLTLPSAAAAGPWLAQVVPLPNGTVHDIALLLSSDGGRTWGDPWTVATGIDLPGVLSPWIDGRDDGNATLAWVHRVEGGWTASALRVDLAARAVQGPVRLAEATDIPQGIGHEFITVDHLPDGRAVVAWPMDTGPACDPAPNPVESRGSQCVYVAVENATAPA